MNTTYAEIWDKFETIARFDEYDLPTTIDGRRKLINASVDIFNIKRFDELECDNTLDEINRQLTPQEIMLLVHCMKLQVCHNIYSDFTTTYSMYQKEVGFKDYKAQVDSRETLIKLQENVVDDIVFSMTEDFEG